MYGIIDIGSNTIRLSIYKQTETSFELMLNKKIMAGLAGFVEKDGCLSEDGINKAITSLLHFKKILTYIQVQEVFVFATASLRNVTNTDEAIRTIEETTGFTIDLVSGKQEAIYDFVGATHFMDLKDGLLVDIGGGSTELVVCKDGKIQVALSLPFGSLNLYSNHVSDIIPTEKEMSKIKRVVEQELSRIKISGNYKIICGIGGSIRGTRRLCNAVFGTTPEQGKTIHTKQVTELLEKFSENRKKAISRTIKTLPDRIHTIIPGMIILETIAKKYDSKQIIASDYGVREGYLYTKLFGEEVKYEV